MSRGTRCKDHAWRLLAACAVVLWAGTAPAMLVPGDWGQISADCLTRVEIIVTGTVVSHRNVKVPPWWEGYRQGPNLVPSEAQFRIDDCFRGPAGLVGKVVRIRYVGSEGRGMDVGVDFVQTVGDKRCLVCVHPVNADEGVYQFPTDNGAFAVVGAKPPPSDASKPMEERLARELASAITSGDRRVAMNTMRYAPKLNLPSADLVAALRSQTSNGDAEIAATAVGALIRLGETGLLYVLEDLPEIWKGNAPNYLSGAVYETRSTEAVPAIVALLRRPESRLRESAAYALRNIKSSDSVAALMTALDDPEEMTRYHAAMALAFQTNRINSEWAWGLPHFRENSPELINKWKTWWESEGKAKYPPVETVLKEYERKREEYRKGGPAAVPSASQSGPSLARTGIPKGWGEIFPGSFADADVVCSGVIESSKVVAEVAPFWTEVVLGADLEAIEAAFKVDRVVKGDEALAGQVIRVQYPATKQDPAGAAPNALPDFGTVCGTQRALVCLRKARGEGAVAYQILYGGGSFMRVGAAPEQADWAELAPKERLAAEIRSALLSDDAQTALSSMKSAESMGLTNDEVLPALRQMTGSDSWEVARTALTLLIEKNDLRTLYDFEHALEIAARHERQTGVTEGFAGGALQRVKDPAAAPALAHLLHSKATRIRREAALTLAAIQSKDVFAGLVSALYDPDEQVRYRAVKALYVQTGRETGQWGPEIEEFRKNPDVHIQRWKTWWEEKGKAEYPSLETVLQRYEAKRTELLKAEPAGQAP